MRTFFSSPRAGGTRVLGIMVAASIWGFLSSIGASGQPTTAPSSKEAGGADVCRHRGVPERGSLANNHGADFLAEERLLQGRVSKHRVAGGSVHKGAAHSDAATAAP